VDTAAPVTGGWLVPYTEPNKAPGSPVGLLSSLSPSAWMRPLLTYPSPGRDAVVALGDPRAAVLGQRVQLTGLAMAAHLNDLTGDCVEPDRRDPGASRRRSYFSLTSMTLPLKREVFWQEFECKYSHVFAIRSNCVRNSPTSLQKNSFRPVSNSCQKTSRLRRSVICALVAGALAGSPPHRNGLPPCQPVAWQHLSLLALPPMIWLVGFGVTRGTAEWAVLLFHRRLLVWS